MYMFTNNYIRLFTINRHAQYINHTLHDLSDQIRERAAVLQHQKNL